MNNGKLTLEVRRRTFPEWMVLWIALFPLLTGTFFSLANLPTALKYTLDVGWVSLLLIMMFSKGLKNRKDTRPLFFLALFLFLFLLMVYVFRYQSIYYFLWGARNNFRFYVFFFGVILFFKKIDIDSLFKLFNFAFWINLIAVLFQYFIYGHSGDFLGGIFGVEKGCNAYTIIFITIVVGVSMLRYMSHKESAFLCFLKSASSLVVAALAELKFFFVIFILIVVISFFCTSFSWKKVVIMVTSMVLLMVASMVLVSLFEVESFLNIDQIWQLATQENYSSQETVNRLSAIPTLAKTILTDPIDRIFGLGLGNCETSTFALVNTPFYEQFFYLRYNWFSCAFVFLEQGYIGVIAQLSFFVLYLVLIRKRLKAADRNPVLCYLGIIMAVVSITLFFYNSSLRAEGAYLVYLIMALPFVGTFQQPKDEKILV